MGDDPPAAANWANGSRSASPLVVACLYNLNGMGTWCWEAAHALAEAGQPVLLVCVPAIALPGKPGVDVFRFSTSSSPIVSRVRSILSALSARPAPLLQKLHAELQAAGFAPRAYLLNQTSFHCPEVPVPQYVVGWVGDSGLGYYLRSIPRIAGWRPFRRLARSFIDVVGWYRKDWRGYRAADGVLAVTKRLADGLLSQAVVAHVVHPGTALGPAKESARQVGEPLRVITTALDLDDPRKHIRFLLAALMSRPVPGMTLTLAGHASDILRAEVAKVGVPVKFTGLLPRDQLVKLTGEHDIFFFGSRSDDWGYVLIEALAQGLWLVAPRQPPFDEIIGDCGNLFDPDSPADAAEQLARAVVGYDPTYRSRARARAERLFSRQAFASQIRAAIGAAWAPDGARGRVSG